MFLFFVLSRVQEGWIMLRITSDLGLLKEILNHIFISYCIDFAGGFDDPVAYNFKSVSFPLL